MDRALDDVVRERQASSSSRRSSRRGPRGGVRKPRSRDNSRGNYDESRLWVHDKFDGNNSAPEAGESRRTKGRGRSDVPPGGAKLKVTNIHYDLGEDELLSLFRRKGPVTKLTLLYDRAGRSDGTAFVFFANLSDAEAAIREFDGANANGQPISLTLVAGGKAEGRGEARSLFDRIRTPPEERERRDPTRKPTPPGIDRYVPPDRRRQRAESDRGGDRGERRGGNSGRRGEGRRARGGTGSGNGRSQRKTVEELDAEMNDYFGAVAEDAGQATGGPALAAAKIAEDGDEEMIL